MRINSINTIRPTKRRLPTAGGDRRDKETNFDYFGARYYNSKIGLWYSVDPLAEARVWLSPYNFVQSNPINCKDPTGMIDDRLESVEGKRDENGKIIIDMASIKDDGDPTLYIVDDDGNRTESINLTQNHDIQTQLYMMFEKTGKYDSKFLSDALLGSSNARFGEIMANVMTEVIIGYGTAGIGSMGRGIALAKFGGVKDYAKWLKEIITSGGGNNWNAFQAAVRNDPKLASKLYALMKAQGASTVRGYSVDFLTGITLPGSSSTVGWAIWVYQKFIKD